MGKYGDFSPVVKYGLPDYKRDSPQWENWLEEQLHYIHNGFTHGGTTISGRLYFKLNFFKLRHLEDGESHEKIISPYYVDAQKDLYDLVEECFTDGEDLLVGKGRDKGFSYDLASLMLYETQFFPTTDVMAIFPAGTSTAKGQFRTKYDSGWNNLLEDLRQYPGLSNNAEVLKYGWKETDEETKQTTEQGLLSSISLVEAVNADVAKSGRFKILGLEEFGEIKNPLRLITTSRANLQKGSRKFGLILAGGTSNAFNDGYKDFRELWFNASSYGFKKFFIPANKSLWGFVNEQGESDLEGGEKWVLDRRKGKSDDILTIETQNYPLTEEEMFVSINKSPFNSIYTSQQVARIMTDKTITNQIRRGNLIRNRLKNMVEFVESVDGRWQVFAMPSDKLFNKDVGAVDPYRKGDSTQSDSKGAIVIYRSFNGMDTLGNMPICIYHNKPKTKDMFFEDCLLTAEFYNIQLLFEHTEDDWIDYFAKRNATKYLKARPRLGESIYTKVVSKYGVNPSAHNKGTALELAVQDFDQHYENHPFIELLDELNSFGGERVNTDLAMAYIWAVLHASDNIKMLDEFRPKKKEKKFVPYVISTGGKLIVVNNPQAAKAASQLVRA